MRGQFFHPPYEASVSPQRGTRPGPQTEAIMEDVEQGGGGQDCQRQAVPRSPAHRAPPAQPAAVQQHELVWTDTFLQEEVRFGHCLRVSTPMFNEGHWAFCTSHMLPLLLC